MFIIDNGKDISNEDFHKIYQRHVDVVHDYFVNNIIPETIAFYLSSGYRLNSISNVPFDIHVSTCINYFNIKTSQSDIKRIEDETKNILKIRYGIIVSSMDPIVFKELY